LNNPTEIDVGVRAADRLLPCASALRCAFVPRRDSLSVCRVVLTTGPRKALQLSAALRLMPLHLLTGVGLLPAVLSAQTIEGIHLIGIGGAAVFLVVAVTTGRGGRQGREGGGG